MVSTFFNKTKKVNSDQERIGNRLGYMGTDIIMMSPYLLKYDDLGDYTYLIGSILSIPQVWLQTMELSYCKP